jgi:hypothetical protein
MEQNGQNRDGEINGRQRLSATSTEPCSGSTPKARNSNRRTGRLTSSEQRGRALWCRRNAEDIFQKDEELIAAQPDLGAVLPPELSRLTKQFENLAVEVRVSTRDGLQAFLDHLVER